MSKTVPENCLKLAIHETRAFMASVCRDSWNNPALFSHRQNQFSQTHTICMRKWKNRWNIIICCLNWLGKLEEWMSVKTSSASMLDDSEHNERWIFSWFRVGKISREWIHVFICYFTTAPFQAYTLNYLISFSPFMHTIPKFCCTGFWLYVRPTSNRNGFPLHSIVHSNEIAAEP